MAGVDAYKRRYKMRAVGQDSLNIVVSIPRVVIAREAEKSGITVREFLEQFRAVAQYDDFEGVIYCFERIETGEDVEGNAPETRGTVPVQRRAT